jgi:glycosyltransferase involved in cell wall biosynthesis
VLGSLREGISNTVLEAMASGLPVIASDTGGNPELVRNGINGILVAPGDTESLVAAISQYLDDPELCRRHGKHSRELAEREFSLSGMIERYRALYNGLVEEALA